MEFRQRGNDTHASYLFAAGLFGLSGLEEGRLKLAFTYWLQNVPNTPVSLPDKSVRRFCAQNGLPPEALIAAADELDVNLALVDDLVQCALGVAEARPTQPQQQAGAAGAAGG